MGGALINRRFLVTFVLFFYRTSKWGDARNPFMKADTHPRYEEITARCSCGNEIKTRSTVCDDILLDVCSQCHPFFTGKQKILDTGGRVDRFNKRFAGRSLKK